MTEEDVRKAVELAKMRDNRAIAKLYEEYHNSVYFLCLRIVKDEDEAFDLVQNSFLTAFNKLDSLQNPVCFGSWLHQIAANQCKNHLKKKQPMLFSEEQGDENGIPEEFDMEDRDESLIPDQALDTSETRRLLMEIIDGLPDLQRMTVMLYYYEEQSLKEISVTMDCSENTVKSRLNYARKQIKAGVEDLEKKGTKLHGVFPMLFPLIRHAAADTSVPPEASTLMLKHIASSVNQSGTASMNEISSPKNTPTGPKASFHKHLWSAARNFAVKFSAMSLPVKIGSIAAALAVISGVTVGVVVTVHAGSSTPVSCKVSSQAPSSKPLGTVTIKGIVGYSMVLTNVIKTKEETDTLKDGTKRTTTVYILPVGATATCYFQNKPVQFTYYVGQGHRLSDGGDCSGTLTVTPSMAGCFIDMGPGEEGCLAVCEVVN